MVKWPKLLLCLLLTVACVSTGCEPLRKKFTRKKKESTKTDQFVPVLEPEEYAAPKVDPLAQYAHRYNLWNLWYDDFMTGLEESGSNKRQRYLIGQMIVQCEEMAKFLQGEPLAQMQDAVLKLQGVQQVLESPVPMRNTVIVKNKVNAVNAQIREKLRPEVIKDILP